ncbi:MAG: hypothetical protein AB7D01_01210 [Methanoculleus sp.]|jgi:hypothetical protein
MEEQQPQTLVEGIDPELGQMPDLWEDDQAQETCPVRVPLDQWQSFLRRQRETWEMLEEDYPEDEAIRRRELHKWIAANQPEPMTLSERLENRLSQVREQMRIFETENAEFDEKTGAPTLYREALETFREYEIHVEWLRRRLRQLWEPQTPELQALDRELWVAENLWEDRLGAEPEIEDRLWDEGWLLEKMLIDRHPL